MPRIARVVAVGYPHHITQRGNYRQDLFESDADRRLYLALIRSESLNHGLEILAYCLMTNHVHFIAVPRHEESMAHVFKYANMKYSAYFNKRKGMGGHLFQGRFFSSVMDEEHTVVCARYVERNPVRARIVAKPWEWEWSSASVHCGILKSDLACARLFDYVNISQGEWQEYITFSDDTNDVLMIRNQTRKGRPLGENGFVKNVERKLGRELILKPVGRPAKKIKSKIEKRHRNGESSWGIGCLSLIS